MKIKSSAIDVIKQVRLNCPKLLLGNVFFSSRFQYFYKGE